MSFSDPFWNMLTYDIGIDLGTANTLVCIRNVGIVISEPSVVAFNTHTKNVIAVGIDAQKMLGKTPASIVAVRPLKDGVISDFEATKEMIRYFIEKVHSDSTKFFKIPRPRVVIGIPSAITEVEKKAVIDAAISAGSRKVYLVEEPIAAAIGAELPITEPAGSLIVDIGGGTTDIAIISLGGIVIDKSMRIAGDELTIDIVNYIRSKYNLMIGDRTAENIKINLGNAYPRKNHKTMEIKGRDILSGLPKVVNISEVEVREAMSNSLGIIIDAISDALEEAPPELISDITDKGIYVTGGGALIPGIKNLFSEKLHLPVNIVDNPLYSVVNGSEKILEDITILEDIYSSEDLSDF